MWQKDISKVLTQTGWGSGFRLPIANKENLELERELERKQRKLIQLQSEMEDNTIHTDILKKKLDELKIHRDKQHHYDQAQYASIEKEMHLKKKAEMEHKKYIRELRLHKEKIEKLMEINNSLCEDFEERKLQVRELVDIIEYDRRELARLEKHAEAQDVYLEMLEELCESDAEMLKKNRERYRAAGEEVSLARKELERDVASTTVARKELDSLSERFRNLHHERSQVVDLWKNALISLKSREIEMHDVAEEFADTKFDMKHIDLELECEQNKFESYSKQTKSSDFQLNKLDRKVQDIRDYIRETSEIMQKNRDGLISYETSISLASKELVNVNKKTQEIEKELFNLYQKISDSTIELEDLKARADFNKMLAMTAAEKTKQIEVMIDEEQVKLEALRKCLEKFMEKKSLWSGKIIHLSKQSNNIDHEIKQMDKKIKLIIKKSKDAEETFDQRRGTIYRLELQAISLESKIKMRINPKQFDSQKFSKSEEKLVNLKKILQDSIHNRTFLNTQTSHLDDVNRRVYRESLLAVKQSDDLEYHLNDIRSNARFFEKFSEDMDKDLDDNLVDLSLTKLKLNQLQNLVKEEQKTLHNLENHKLLIQSVIKEKRIEFEAFYKLREIQRRGIREEVSKLKYNLALLYADIEKKKNRYELSKRLIAKPEEGEEMQSELYYVLKMAQEREILKREGDMWDARVKELERDTMAMQNTLALMNTSNFLVKDTLKPAIDSEFKSELEALQNTKKELQIRKKEALNSKIKIQKEINEKELEIDSIKKRRNSIENVLINKEYEYRMIQNNLQQQTGIQQRYNERIRRLLKLISFTGKEEKCLVSIDIKFRLTKIKLQFAVKALAKVISLYEDIFPEVKDCLYEKLGEQKATFILKKLCESLSLKECELLSKECSTPSSSSNRTKMMTQQYVDEASFVLSSPSKDKLNKKKKVLRFHKHQSVAQVKHDEKEDGKLEHMRKSEIEYLNKELKEYQSVEGEDKRISSGENPNDRVWGGNDSRFSDNDQVKGSLERSGSGGTGGSSKIIESASSTDPKGSKETEKIAQGSNGIKSPLTSSPKEKLISPTTSLHKIEDE